MTVFLLAYTSLITAAFFHRLQSAARLVIVGCRLRGRTGRLPLRLMVFVELSQALDFRVMLGLKRHIVARTHKYSYFLLQLGFLADIWP